jgi:cystathionine gamma-lyase
MVPDAMRFDTLAIHAGQEPDPTTGAIMTPVYLTSTYVQAGPGEHKGYEYSRTRNPTRTALEGCLAALEGARFGNAFASGCAATDTLIHLLDTGDHVVCSDDVYGGTFRLFDKVFKRLGLAFSFVDLSKPGTLEAALTPKTRMVWLETPTTHAEAGGPRAGGEICRRGRIVTGLRQHLSSPVLPAPARALASTWSCTRPPSTSTGTATRWAASSPPAIRSSRSGSPSCRTRWAVCPSPMDSFLVLRGVKTLERPRWPSRAERDEDRRVPLRLTRRPGHVVYPGIASHPPHALAGSR